MTQYIADLLRKLQQQLKELSETIEKIVAPEDGDYVYIDKTRGGLDDHDHVIPPYETNDNISDDNSGN